MNEHRDEAKTTNELETLLGICSERERQCRNRDDQFGACYWADRYEQVEDVLLERPEWLASQAATSIRLIGGL